MKRLITLGCVLYMAFAGGARAQIIPQKPAKPAQATPTYAPQPALSIFRNPASTQQTGKSAEPSPNPLYPTISIAPIVSAPLVGSLLSGAATTPAEAESHARKTEATGSEIPDLEKPVSPPTAAPQSPTTAQTPATLQLTPLTLTSLDLKPLTLAVLSPGGPAYGPHNLTGLETAKPEHKPAEAPKPPVQAAPRTAAPGAHVGGFRGGAGGLGSIPRPHSPIGARR